MNNFIIKGNICFSTSGKELKTLSGYAVCKDGKSAGVFNEIPAEFKNYELRNYGDMLIIPGMVDLHIHAPQYAFRGMGMDYELIEWLNNRTFPEEAKYASTEYAKKAYSIFAESMKNSATTRACIFATKHRAATEILMDLMENTGLITYVGKINMDRNAPDALVEESTDRSAYDTFGWLNEIKDRYKRTKPILTPRFIPSCTDALMGELWEFSVHTICLYSRIYRKTGTKSSGCRNFVPIRHSMVTDMTNLTFLVLKILTLKRLIQSWHIASGQQMKKLSV